MRVACPRELMVDVGDDRHVAAERIGYLRGLAVKGHLSSIAAGADASLTLAGAGQLDDTINSVCRNVAEGFPCSHLNEVREALHAAALKGYISDDEVAPMSVSARTRERSECSALPPPS